MALPPPTVKRPLGRFQLAMLFLGGMLAIVMFGSPILFHIYNSTIEEKYRGEVRRAHDAGLPTNPEELGRYYHNDEAAERLGIELMKSFVSHDTTNETRDGKYYFDRRSDLSYTSSADDLVQMRAHVKANQAYLDQLRQLINANEKVRFPLDFSQGWNMPLTHVADVREAAKLMSIQSQILLADGDTHGLEALLLDSAREPELLKDDPLLIPQLGRTAAHAIVHAEIEYAVNVVAISDDTLRRLKKYLATIDLNGMMASGFVGERCMTYYSLNGSLRFTGRYEAVKRLLSPSKNIFKDVWIENAFLTYTDLIKIGELDPWIRQESACEVEENVSGLAMPLHLVDGLLVPGLGAAFGVENRALADIDTTLVAIAALIFACERGELPRDLAALVPEYMESIPVDPFDGKPLRYKRTDAGFVVYSIGTDGKDDGGSPVPNAVAKTGFDLVFRLLDVRPYLAIQ